jgi:hypothetical protein
MPEITRSSPEATVRGTVESGPRYLKHQPRRCEPRFVICQRRWPQAFFARLPQSPRFNYRCNTAGGYPAHLHSAANLARLPRTTEEGAPSKDSKCGLRLTQQDVNLYRRVALSGGRQ